MEKKWSVGDPVAHQAQGRSRGDVAWVVTEIDRLTPTQGICKNGVRFKLSTGFLIGGNAIGKVVDPTDPAQAEAIERDNQRVAREREWSKQRSRCLLAVDRITRGAGQALNTEQLRVIADAIEATLDKQEPLVRLSLVEVELARQWFNAVQDLNPGYLVVDDYELAATLYKGLGLSVPNSITEKLNDSGNA